jgi:hypothetical protein
VTKAKRKASKGTKHQTPPAPISVPAGEKEGPPPIDPARLRTKALDELFKLIVEGTANPEGRHVERKEPRAFLLSPRAIAALLDAADESFEQPAEHVFARVLLHHGLFGVACLGLPWPDVLAGCMRLAMGERIPTVEEIAALRGKAAVAAGR